MKKLLTVLVYALTFMTPALIVQYYSRFVDPMTPGEVKMATIAGTTVMLLLAAITGFSGKKPKLTGRTLKNVKPAGMNEIVVTDPASKAETLFRWNDKEQLWESDHGTYLDEEHMEEWLKQRGSDRAWANEQMKKLKSRNTAFDRDIDAMGKKTKRK